MLGSSTLKVGTFNKHLVNRKHKGQRVKKAIVAGLMLTSMVDMFSLLVIFLLQSFSNSPEVVMSKGIILPSAISAQAPIDAPVISISSQDIFLDQKIVGPTPATLENPETLITQLENLKNRWTQAHPDQEFKGDIHLQADKGMSSTWVSQVISVLISQGYYSVHLATVAGQNAGAGKGE